MLKATTGRISAIPMMQSMMRSLILSPTDAPAALYRSLVRDKKIALFAGGQSGFPGNKYPNLYLFYAVPTQGNTPETLASAIHEEIEKLKTTDISDDELRMIKTRAKADLIRGLGDNEGLAQQLCTFQGEMGDWERTIQE